MPYALPWLKFDNTGGTKIKTKWKMNTILEVAKQSILPFSETFEKINSAEVIINDASSNHFPITMNS